MGCLDEHAVLEFINGTMAAGAQRRAEEHLAVCSTCTDLVTWAASELAQASGAANEPRSLLTQLAAGQYVGRYQILTAIGRGGMGEVYAAYHPVLDRRIALKVVYESGADTREHKARLLREARAIARLSHPNIVTIHDAGDVAGDVYIAMEYVEGMTLDAWLGAEPRGWRDVLEVFIQVGEGLAAAHAAGIVHRDLKPQNIMIDRQGVVRVMDFGLARLGDEDRIEREPASAPDRPDSSVTITKAGTLIGTPAYMAPEQFRREATDGRADQFSFCVALHEALYGARPRLAHLEPAAAAPPPDDGAATAQRQARLPAWLRTVVQRGLSQDPEDRFSSMNEVIQALRRGRDRLRRRFSVLVAGAVVALLSVGGWRLAHPARYDCRPPAAALAAAWPLRPPDDPRREHLRKAVFSSGRGKDASIWRQLSSTLDDYITHWASMYKETCEATRVLGEQSADVMDLRMSCLDERLGHVRALVDVIGTGESALVDGAISAAGALPSLDRCSDVPLLRAVTTRPDAPVVQGRIAILREGIARVRIFAEAGRCADGLAIGRPLQADAKALGYKPVEAEISLALGRMFDTCLDLDEALADLEEAVMAAEASRHDEVAIEGCMNLGIAYAERVHDLPAGRNWLRLADAILARFPGHPLLQARLAVARSSLFLNDGRAEDAFREAQGAMLTFEKFLGPSSADLASAANNAANALHELGRDAEAAENIHRSRMIIAEVFGEDTGKFALSLLNEAEILTALGRFEEAHADIARGMRIWRSQAAGPTFIGFGLLTEGRLHLAEHNRAAAATALREAIAVFGTQHAGLKAEAESLLKKAIDTPRSPL